jgi:hypothetical protein
MELFLKVELAVAVSVRFHVLPDQARVGIGHGLLAFRWIDCLHAVVRQRLARCIDR